VARDTAALLLDAASSACAEQGFDGATLAEIARRAGVTAAAVYNHFDSREHLLYAAGRRGLQRMTEAAGAEPRAETSALRAVAAAYLRPDMAETRRLLAELHLASRRDRGLAELLGEWHTAVAADLVGLLPADDPSPEATVKALFLLLLGLCHLEDLDAVAADPDALRDRVGTLVDVLHPS
jgi:AcrR family transcriptional regulator